MPWITYSTVLVSENFKVTAQASAAVASFYRLTYRTTFPTKHRILLGVARNAALAEVLPVNLVYPSQYPVVMQVTPISIWNNLFCFYVRSLRWGDSLPPLNIDFAYWQP